MVSFKLKLTNAYCYHIKTLIGALSTFVIEIQRFHNRKKITISSFFNRIYQNINHLVKLFVTGGFNSRTADEPDFLLHDYSLNVGVNKNLRDNEIPLRKSRDIILDNYGRRLLDLCKSTNLLIANGRLGDDKNIVEFTCVTSRRRSVVDYILLSLYDFYCVSHFSIGDIDEHSDHSGLLFLFEAY